MIATMIFHLVNTTYYRWQGREETILEAGWPKPDVLQLSMVMESPSIGVFYSRRLVRRSLFRERTSYHVLSRNRRCDISFDGIWLRTVDDFSSQPRPPDHIIVGRSKEKGSGGPLTLW